MGQPFYVPRKALELDEAVDLIRRAGGRPVIAHPLSLYVSWGSLPDRLKRWREAGVEGLEARHSGATEREARRLEDLAAGAGMFVTGGSDFHGDNRPDRKLGRGAGNRPLPEGLLEPLVG